MNKISFHRKLSISTMEQNYLIRILLLLQLIFILQINTEAEIRYVSKTGSSTPPYLSWEDAADSIMECINISNSGDTIYVGNGVYEEQVVMIPGISLIGAGTDSCTIDTRTFINTQMMPAIIIKDSCLITSFKILVANDNAHGSGISVRGECVIKNNSIVGCFTGVELFIIGEKKPYVYNNVINNCQVGIYVVNSNAIIRGNNIIAGANAWRGIDLDEIQPLYKVVIDSNLIVTNANAIFKTFILTEITNNIIILYGSSDNGIDAGDTVLIYNNLLISENSKNYGAFSITNYCYNNYFFGYFGWGSIATYNNNIIKNNVVTGSPLGITKVISSHNPVIQYNDSWNNGVNYAFPVDSTNLSVDPMIVNDDSTQGELDFHLQMFSPLIDRGDPAILDKDSSRSDIGLYGGPLGESYPYLDYPPRIPHNFTALVDSEQILLSWKKNTESDFAFYRLYRDTVAGFEIDSTSLISEQSDTFFIQIPPDGITRLYYKVTSVDSQGNESSPSVELAVILTPVAAEPVIVSNYILYQNYPNPFNPSTKIAYQLKTRGYVKLYVYDIKGELVATLVNESKEAGYHEVEFTPENSSKDESWVWKIASGIYVYRIMVKGESGVPVFTDSKKMIYLK